MKKIKLLFDVESIRKEFNKNPSGICRVADELFKRLIKERDVDVYPLLTDRSGDFNAYLEKIGRMDLKDKTVLMPYLKKTTKLYKKFSSFKNYIYRFLYGWRVKKILNKFDVYFSPTPVVSPLIYLSNIKSIAIIHDLIPINYSEFSTNLKYERKFRAWIDSLQVDNVLTVSDFTLNEVIDYLPQYSYKNTNILPLAADQKFKKINDKHLIERVKRKYKISSSKYILSLSDMSKRKNFIHSVKSFIELMKMRPNLDVCLVLAGSHRSGFDLCLSSVDGYEKFKKQIILTGFIDEDDIVPLYNGASVFLFPSLVEGFGLPLLEAMSCGCPVVCTKGSALQEIGRNCAIFIDGYDYQKTAKELGKILWGSKSYENRSTACLREAQKYSWEKTVEILMKEIRCLKLSKK